MLHKVSANEFVKDQIVHAGMSLPYKETPFNLPNNCFLRISKVKEIVQS